MFDKEGFKQYLMAQDKSQNTIDCYLRDVDELGGWASNSLGLGVGGVAQINLTYFKKKLKREGYSLITVNRKIAAVNAFYRFLGDTGVKDEVLFIKPYRIMNGPSFKGLDEIELWKIRTEVHRVGNKMHICIFEMLLNTGIRVSELVSIKSGDINISERKGTLTVIGKGDVQRVIPLNKDCRDAIKGYLETRKNYSNTMFFIGQRGPLKRNAINSILKKYGERVGVKISAHKLRHSLGYALTKQGKPITTIQQILGHERVTSTQIYSATTERDMQVALEEVQW